MPIPICPAPMTATRSTEVVRDLDDDDDARRAAEWWGSCRSRSGRAAWRASGVRDCIAEENMYAYLELTARTRETASSLD